MVPDFREDAKPPSRLLYSIPEAAQQLGGITERKLWTMIAEGEVRSVKVGRRRMIPASALTEYVHGLEEIAA